MKPDLLQSTRRHFFERCGIGLGRVALASALAGAKPGFAASTNPMAAKAPHFAPKAKRVIYLFMAGGPSQLDLFDYKPKLKEYDGKPTPASFFEGKRFAFMESFSKNVPKLLGTRREFQQYGKSGKWVSECLPHTAQVVDDLAFISTVSTENFNHAPATIFANTGSTQFGRPSMGSWITYGIGSEAEALPGFVVLLSGVRQPFGEAQNWSSGFLPSAYQGVPFQSGGTPILNLNNPPGITADIQKDTLSAVQDMNRMRLMKVGDPEISTRIAAYEMAYRMQTSGPELVDLKSESQATLDMYGIEPGKQSFANNCLMARKLVEKGARFVQLYHMNWDHHGGPGESLVTDLDRLCLETDRGCAALVKDLKQRGLLEDTLVVWGGEFGRTPMGEHRETLGRNHHIDASTMWLAGAGVKPGQTVGETDEFGFSAVDERIDMHDVQATMLHLLGLDHKKLTFRFQGRDFRLTDVKGNVVQKLLS